MWENNAEEFPANVNLQLVSQCTAPPFSATLLPIVTSDFPVIIIEESEAYIPPPVSKALFVVNSIVEYPLIVTVLFEFKHMAPP